MRDDAMLQVLAATVVSVAACGGSPAVPPHVAAPTVCGTKTDDPTVDRAAGAALHCAAIELDATTNVPIIRGRLGTRAMAMVVDTGGVTHILAHAPVAELGLPVEPSDLLAGAGDGHGSLVANGGRAQLVLGDAWPVPQPTLLVADFQRLQDHQLDGIVVPQLLGDAQHPIVLDPAGHRLFSIDAAAAAPLLRGDAAGSPLTTQPIPACEIIPRGMAVAGGRYRVAAEIDGQPAQFVIDTGASVTGLLASSPRAAGRHEGDDFAFTVGRAGGRGKLRLVQIDDERCPFDGLLGQDILSQCTLILFPDHAVARCPLPPASAHDAAR